MATQGKVDNGDELLATKGLVKSFGALVAVNKVDFNLSKHEIRAVIGPNGAGKTTFFDLLTGHLNPTEGKIFFKGKDMAGLSPAQVSQKGVSRSFQVVNIFPNFSVFENIRIGVQSRNRFHSPFIHTSSLKNINEKTRHILKLIGLEEKSGIIAPNLSHGEQRHLEIGIALSTDPILLLLDEPTAGMSAAETIETVKLIKKTTMEQSLTVIVIEHDMNVVMELADTITVFHQGWIIAEGSPDEIKKDKEVQEAYLKGA